MPSMSDWFNLNGSKVRVSWSEEGQVLSILASLELSYERTWYGIGPFRPAIEPDAVSVGAYAYTPVIAGDVVGPRRYVGAIGAPVAITDKSGELTVPSPFVTAFSGSVQGQENGILVVYHFLDAAGRVLPHSISLSKVIQLGGSGNDPADFVATLGQTMLDGTSNVLAAAAADLIQMLSDSTGLDKTTVTLLLLAVAAAVVILVLR